MFETDLYFEAHVTIDPVFGKDLDKFKNICDTLNFRVADLFMQKRKEDTPERSKFDSFCTTRSQNFEDILQRTVKLVNELKLAKYTIRRWKIENTLIDVRWDI